MTYKLNTPVHYVVQEKNQSGDFEAVKYEVSEVEVPETFTAGDFRKIKATLDDTFNFAAQVMQLGGLQKQATLQLEAADLIGFFEQFAPCLEFDESKNSEDAIKYLPKRYTYDRLSKVTASQQAAPFEWSCQVIELCGGFKRSEIDDLPCSYVIFLMQHLAESIFAPKK
jgi:hypothetical protein